MKPRDLNPVDIALFARVVGDTEEYKSLSDSEKAEIAAVLSAAKAAAGAYTGLDVDQTDFDDVTYAIKVMATEMLDNRQITAQYTGKNPLVYQILDLHSNNLLPSVGE